MLEQYAGVLLRRCEAYEDVFDRWIEAGEWTDVTREQRKDRSVFNVDISQIRHPVMMVLPESQQAHVSCL